MKRAIRMAMVVGATLGAYASGAPEDVRQAVESMFPGAVIKEVEQETWKGQSVTEVELTDQDGKHFEVLLSSDGEILNVEEEKRLPWIGGELDLGLAMRVEREIYKGVGTEFEPSLFFMYENGPLEILAYDGMDATLRLFGNDWLSLRASGSILFEEGYDPDDSDYVEGMDEIGTEALPISGQVRPLGLLLQGPILFHVFLPVRQTHAA